MRRERGAAGTIARWWLPAVVTGAMAPVMFVVGVRSDPPEVRAGAEPVVSGIAFAAPFVWLFLFDASCGLWATLSASRRGRRGALTAMTVAATVAAGLLVWWLGVSAVRDGSLERGLVTALLVVLLLGPVAPGWVAHRQENRQAVPAR